MPSNKCLNEFNLYQLIQTGKKNGFLKLEDLLSEFKDFTLNDEQIDAICNIFGDIGISIYNSNEAEYIKFDDSEIDIESNGDGDDEDISVYENETITNNTMKILLYDIGKIPLLSHEQEYELAKQCANGDKYAKELLVVSNMRLVVNVAKKYQGRGVPMADLISNGYFGLRKAIEKFDYKKGFKLSTYATWWIRQSITRDIGDNGRSVRIPIHIIEQLNKYNRIYSELWQKLGTEPTDKEIAQKMGITLEKITEIKKYAQDTQSLSGMSSQDDNEPTDYIGKSNYTPQTTIKEADIRNAINDVLDTLSTKEADIIRVKYGLIDGKPKTLEETGKYFNITRERVRQIENKAIRKLKHPSKSGVLKDLLNYDD